ncbi:MAG: hypothetical protein KDK23_12435, partial [Leptospiraceae bacterium]|nr:hypothetical protein [Leptospiraceae bacterium]
MSRIGRNRPFLLILLASVFFLSGFYGLQAGPANNSYTPPGQGPGQNVTDFGWGIDTGFKTIEDDYYITVTPQFELPFPLYRDIKFGLQVPLEILVYDTEPQTAEKVPDIRTGTYDTWEDYSQLVLYIRKGTHGHYEP